MVKVFDNIKMTFFASELRLRGDAYIAQPHRDEQGNILCWNGEVNILVCGITNAKLKEYCRFSRD